MSSGRSAEPQSEPHLFLELGEERNENEAAVYELSEHTYQKPVYAGHDNGADTDAVKPAEKQQRHCAGDRQTGEIKDYLEFIPVQTEVGGYALDEEVVDLRIDV